MKHLQVICVGLTLLLLPARSPAQTKSAGEIRIVTWNVEWLFDHITAGANSGNKTQLARENSAPSANAYYWRIEHIAKAVAQIKPTVLALQEIENNKVLKDLADQLRKKHGLKYETAFVQGSDIYTEQDVGFLFRDGTAKASLIPFDRLYRNNRSYTMPSRHAVLECIFGVGVDARKLIIVNVHLKAGQGIGNEQKRINQARVVRHFLQSRIQRNEHIVILGDFNAGKPFTQTSARDAVGVMVGLETTKKQDDFFDLGQFLSKTYRQTHITKRELDRILISPSLVRGTGLQFVKTTNHRKLVVRGRGPDFNRGGRLYKIAADEVDLSDHYPLEATIRRK